MIRSIRALVLLSIVFSSSSHWTLGSSQCSSWDSQFSAPGTDRPIQALCSFDDGSGSALYLGGQFTSAGGLPCQRIAKWRGDQWFALGSGVGNGEYDYVDALAVFDDGSGPALFAGGSFSSAGGQPVHSLAKWNGTTWASVPGFNGDTVRTLLVFDDGHGAALYVGEDSYLGARIMKWDGRTWSLVGTCAGSSGTSVRCMAVHNDGSGPAFYIGGSFTGVNSVHAKGIARWNGTTWSAVGSLSGDWVYSLTFLDAGFGPELYAIGTFPSGGSGAPHSLAKWNGVAWTIVGPDTDSGWFYASAVYRDGGGSALVAAYHDRNTLEGDIVRWDGVQMSRLGANLQGGATVLLEFDSSSGPALFAAGDMSGVSGLAVGNIARWNGVTWSALDDSTGKGGPDSAVDAFAVFDDGSGPALYVAGQYMSSAGGVAARGIARWNGFGWSDTGMDDWNVRALIVHDDGTGPALYAGGGTVRRWDGAHWAEVGTGLHTYLSWPVDALAVFDDGSGPALYAGGNFSLPGLVGQCQVAKWDGSSWTPVAETFSYDPVLCLSVFDDGTGPALYAGAYEDIGWQAIDSFAKWDGSAWTSVGDGAHGEVYTMTTFDDGSGPALYIGGHLGSFGNPPNLLDGVARWDGLNWSAVTSTTAYGIEDTVYALTVFDDGTGPALFAGGEFYNGSTAFAPGSFAKWDGSNWLAAGADLNMPVHAMAVFDQGDGPDLFVGGEFTSAGRYASAHIARFKSCFSPTPADIEHSSARSAHARSNTGVPVHLVGGRAITRTAGTSCSR